MLEIIKYHHTIITKLVKTLIPIYKGIKILKNMHLLKSVNKEVKVKVVIYLVKIVKYLKTITLSKLFHNKEMDNLE